VQITYSTVLRYLEFTLAIMTFHIFGVGQFQVEDLEYCTSQTFFVGLSGLEIGLCGRAAISPSGQVHRGILKVGNINMLLEEVSVLVVLRPL